MLARTLRAAVRLPGHHTIGAVSARCDVGAGCPGASQTRCWSAATDVEYRDRPATQPIPPRAGPATRLETLVDPGSLLKVHLPLLHANVHVMIGELDRIVCEVLPTAGEEGQRGLPVMAACGPGHSTGHVASNTLQVVEGGGGGAVTVRAWIPERFCTVEVATAGGTVEVAGITEGHLTVVSGGGDVTLGKIRSATAHVHTAGGQLTANVLSAMLSVDTGGGAFTVKRLVGGTMHVRAGAITAAVVYGDDVRIQCDAAAVEQMQIGEKGLAVLTAAGGHVSVLGLDGSATITTTGGEVVVQLQERSGTVAVHSGGGHVTLRVPEAVPGGLHLTAAGLAGVTLSPPLRCDGTTADGTRVHGVLRGVGVGGTAHRLMVQEREVSGEEEERCAVTVDAGVGRVVVEQRSWFHARFGHAPPSSPR